VIAAREFPFVIQVGGYIGAVVVIGGVCWLVWHTWWQGVAEAKAFDRRQRREQGLCPECGYDVRGTPVRCPECGEPLGIVRAVDPAARGPAADSSEFDITRLHSDWPDAPIDPLPPQPGDPMFQIRSTADGWEADLIVQQLMARGVWATLQVRQQEEVVGGFARRATYRRIVVPESERESAEAILDRFRLGPSVYE
jgi:hypothetical protein